MSPFKYLLVLVLLWIMSSLESSSAGLVTYVKLTATNNRTGQSKKICANMQPFSIVKEAERIRKLVKSSFSLRLLSNEIELCHSNRSSFNGQIVVDTFSKNQTVSKSVCPISFYLNETERIVDAQHGNASAFLIFNDKLFSSYQMPFYNVNTSVMRIPIFFINSKHFMEIEQLYNNSASQANDVLLNVDINEESNLLSFVLMVVLAATSVGFGGLWSGHKMHAALSAIRETGSPTLSNEHKPIARTERSNSAAAEPMTYGSLGCLLIIIVSMLLLLYYFFDYLVWLTIVIFMYACTHAVYSCLALLWWHFLGETLKTPKWHFGEYLAKWLCCCCRDEAKEYYKHVVYTPKHFLLFSIGLAISVVWFVTRKHPYAFILHDILSVVICTFLISQMRIQSLKWITNLLGFLFLYDLFMVFITPFFTNGGCSVMVQAVTGGDCGSDNFVSPPNPNKENVPIVFRMIQLLDPVIDCYDMNIDLYYPMSVLGFGDVIVPGILVGYNYAFDLARGNGRCCWYYIVSMIGYVVGLALAFTALTFMQVAQPALIYIVPCTLLPTVFLALIRKQLSPMWGGELGDHAHSDVLTPVSSRGSVHAGEEDVMERNNDNSSSH